MKEIGKMINSKEMEYWSLQMALCTRVSSPMDNLMEKGDLFI